MKKYVITGLIALTQLLSFAQIEEGNKHIGLNIGGSATGISITVATLLVDSNGKADRVMNKTKAFSATFDYAISERFSIGVLVSTQSFSADVNGFTFAINDTTIGTGRLKYNFRRNNISTVGKLHYNTKSEKLDIYSGLRVGMIFWNNKIEAPEKTKKSFETFGLTRPNISVIPFGMSIYFIPEMCGNMELAIGAPYIISAGLQYKF